MSASTERKNRQTARSEGTYKKDIAAQKEAAKQKKTRTKWIIIGVVIVLFFAFAIYLNTGALYRSLDALTVSNTEITSGDVTISAGERSFSVAECNYVYNMQYVTFVNTYGSYASMFGLDTTQPLDTQACAMGGEEDEDYTWDDYFRDQSETLLKQLAAFEAYANAKGLTLNDDDAADIQETIDAIEETAKENNYANANKFLSANYGKGCNVSVVRGMLELEALANKVQTDITDAQVYTDKELSEKYESVKDSYDKFTYSYYLAAAATEENEDGTTADPTDEAKADAKAVAEKVYASVKDGTALADAVKAIVSDEAEVTEQSDVFGSSVESDISEWLKSADRAEGDMTVIEGSTGSYVVIFTSRNDNKAPTEESGDMNYCDYIAQQLLNQDVLSKWSEDVFSPIMEVYTSEFGGAVRYVGR